MTIYVPDELADEIKAELGDQNMSGIFQAAVRKELDRTKARAELAAEGFERIQIYDTKRRRNLAFKGRLLGEAEDESGYTHRAYLTPKNVLTVFVTNFEDESLLWVYDTYEQFVADGTLPDGLLAAAADALGEEFVEELDI